MPATALSTPTTTAANSTSGVGDGVATLPLSDSSLEEHQQQLPQQQQSLDLNYNVRAWDSVLSATAPSLVTKLAGDCDKVFDGETTFWLGADTAPRCGLEALAKGIFQRYAGKALVSGAADPTRSGCEWWSQVRESREDNALKENAVGFHWDKDEDLLDETGVNVHPQLSTVTYLCTGGAPTIVLDKLCPTYADDAANMHANASDSTHNGNERVFPLKEEERSIGEEGREDKVVEEEEKEEEEEEEEEEEHLMFGDDSLESESHKRACQKPISNVWACYPAMGRHMVFDGRLLHGASSQLQRHEAHGGVRRTFLVNIWLNYRPQGPEPFPDEYINELCRLDKMEVCVDPNGIEAGSESVARDCLQLKGDAASSSGMTELAAVRTESASVPPWQHLFAYFGPSGTEHQLCYPWPKHLLGHGNESSKNESSRNSSSRNNSSNGAGGGGYGSTSTGVMEDPGLVTILAVDSVAKGFIRAARGPYLTSVPTVTYTSDLSWPEVWAKFSRTRLLHIPGAMNSVLASAANAPEDGSDDGGGNDGGDGADNGGSRDPRRDGFKKNAFNSLQWLKTVAAAHGEAVARRWVVESGDDSLTPDVILGVKDDIPTATTVTTRRISANPTAVAAAMHSSANGNVVPVPPAKRVKGASEVKIGGGAPARPRDNVDSSLPASWYVSFVMNRSTDAAAYDEALSAPSGAIVGGSAPRSAVSPLPCAVPNCLKDAAVQHTANAWFFIGYNGLPEPLRGRPEHTDSIQQATWHVQLSGAKTWYVRPDPAPPGCPWPVPPPECGDVKDDDGRGRGSSDRSDFEDFEDTQGAAQAQAQAQQASRLEVTVQTGDLLLIDTARWYHATALPSDPHQPSISMARDFDVCIKGSSSSCSDSGSGEEDTFLAESAVDPPDASVAVVSMDNREDTWATADIPAGTIIAENSDIPDLTHFFHTTEPNCALRKEMDGTVLFLALRDIARGESLTLKQK
eukprot:UC1_evm1s1029